jgi:hypothetical protein
MSETIFATDQFRGAIRQLLNDSRRNVQPLAVPEPVLGLVREGLNRVLIDPDALADYVRYLDALNRPRFFRARDLEPFGRLQAVLEAGLDCLKADELAGLALNPFALRDIREGLEEQGFSDYWWSIATTVSNDANCPGLCEKSLQASTQLEQHLQEFDERWLVNRGSGLGSMLKRAADQPTTLTIVMTQLAALSLPWERCTIASHDPERRLAAKSVRVERHEGSKVAPPEVWAEPTSDGKAVRIECPVDWMPFGIGCCVASEFDAETNDFVVAGAKVFSARGGIARPEVRLALVSVREWLKEAQKLDVMFIPATVDGAGLNLFAQFRQGVEEELQTPQVAGDAELAESIRRLLACIDALAEDVARAAAKGEQEENPR